MSLSLVVVGGGGAGGGGGKQQSQVARRPRGTVGLYNLGNTCFMNSSLQCLSGVPLLMQYFVGQYYVADINPESVYGARGAIADGYGELARELHACDAQGRALSRAVAPRTFKRAIGAFRDQFDGYEQQDGQGTYTLTCYTILCYSIVYYTILYYTIY